MFEHPGKLLVKYLNQQWWTQKAFSLHIWKKVSEINELIKGKRNITIAWDLIFSQVFQTPQKFWVLKQLDYDYQQALTKEKSNFNLTSQAHQRTIVNKFNDEKIDSKSDISQNASEDFLITKVFESF